MVIHQDSQRRQLMYMLTHISLAALLFLSAGALAQNSPEYTLQINSTGLYVRKETLGHAFMIIKVRTKNGVKEEAFGFYSDPEATGIKDIPRLVIGTQGLLKSEFAHHPERFTKVEETIEIPITAQQRQGIYKVVNEWNSHDYELLDKNCITFVDKVATKIGLPVPSRLSYATPNQYIAALRSNYQQEEERRRREAEEAEARRIPPGWVKCTCPSIHAPYGKFVDGILYHPDTVRCPQ